jgi:chromosome segregation protein
VKLKSLEIEGFKSFPNKTLLVFNQNVTGIVGPNGCGKSNVVDAIRWVMGEQSAKHLRGKHMDDVIFAGARDQGPSSVAGVELTFSTDGAQTPPQYEGCKEISIGRKLYRSGESEYFVNKQAVRLKDVKDLFLGTGVGVNAYSIIEQGSIGQLVTAKPEDRRRIIEEAAGISKFQIRKETALRRMEATNQNLLRLRDILAELERQKNSLERQAKKAEKFKLVRDELMALDLSLASTDYRKFDARQEALLAEMKEWDARHVESENAVQESEVRFEELRLELAEVERDAADAQQAVYERDNALSIAESRLHVRKEESTRLDREAADESARLAGSVDALLSTKEAFWRNNESALQADLDCCASEESAASLEETHARTQTQAQELFDALEVARHDYHEASKRLIEIDGRRKSLTHRLEELDAKIVSDTEELESVVEKSRGIAKLLNETQEGLADVKQLKLSLDERTTEAARELGEVETAVAREQTVLETVKEELLRKKSRLHSLEELERNFEGYQDGPRTVLERKRSGEIDSVLGAVADFIETEPRYEGAVSAILGERAQCLVVTQTADSVQCAEWLKTAGSGRGSFVALGLAESRGVTERVLPSVAEIPGCHGFIANFVTAKPGYERLKDVLFGDAVLMDALPQALEAWAGTRLPAVTLDGEVISPEGILSGGTLEKTSKALLEKKREIKELQAEISELVGSVKAKEEQLFDLNRKLKALKSQIDDMKAESHAETVRITVQEKDITQCQRDLESLNERRGRLSRQILSAEEARDFLKEDKALLEENEIRERSVLAEAEGMLNAKKSEEESYRARLHGEQESLTREKVALAEVRERKAGLDREMERLSAEVLRLRLDILRGEERAVLLDKRRMFVDDRVRFAEKNIGRLLTAKRAADDIYSAKKGEFENLNSQVAERELALKDMRRENLKIKEEINKGMLTLTELRSQLTRLKEQAFERYQVSLAEASEQHVGVEETEYADKAARAEELRGQMMRVGGVNLAAIDELKEVSDRFEFLDKQRSDLEASLASLGEAIQKINQTTKRRFAETFELVSQKFSQLFPKLFEGGEAYLKLTDPDNILETGVDIIAQPPGKRLQSITLLSGGEKALTAVSLLFSIFLIKPSPFCLLDEVDAPLDDANVDRYNEIVKEMSQRTQFIVITHNKRTMQVTDALYGVTMEKSGISQLVSVDFGS